MNKEKNIFILDKEKNQNKEMPFVSHLLFKWGFTVLAIWLISDDDIISIETETAKMKTSQYK